MEQNDNHQPRLLAIDGSNLIHRLLNVRLRHERIEIHSATNAHDGIEMARRIQPDVILLDINLNDMDGFEVLTKLKDDPETQNIAVIIVSASAETMDRVRGLELGAIDFISKPFEVVELKARVRSALRVQHLIRMLAQKARIDGMTGLWNRKYFDGRLSTEVANACRHDTSLSLILCDIDHFKKTNDIYGHPFGDIVIERFAQILTSGRAGDIACRYGGEEFAVILPGADKHHAIEVAERFRTRLHEEEWVNHDGLVITASFGVCDLSSNGIQKSGKGLLQAADQALYAAKGMGRNSTVEYESCARKHSA